MVSTKILIEIPSDFDESHQDEIATMLKLLCDNIDVDGIKCSKLKPKGSCDLCDESNHNSYRGCTFGKENKTICSDCLKQFEYSQKEGRVILKDRFII